MTFELRYVRERDCAEAYYTVMPEQLEDILGLSRGCLEEIPASLNARTAPGIFLPSIEYSQSIQYRAFEEKVLTAVPEAIDIARVYLKWTDPMGYVVLVRRDYPDAECVPQSISVDFEVAE
jgi:hypothetical protein